MNIKKFAKDQEKIQKLYDAKYPETKDVDIIEQIKWSIRSEILEFARARGYTHNTKEDYEKQEEELIDIFMFLLKLARCKNEIEKISLDFTEDPFAEDITPDPSTWVKPKTEEDLIKEALEVLELECIEYKKEDSTKFIFMAYSSLLFRFKISTDRFVSIFNRKINLNLERFK